MPSTVMMILSATPLSSSQASISKRVLQLPLGSCASMRSARVHACLPAAPPPQHMLPGAYLHPDMRHALCWHGRPAAAGIINSVQTGTAIYKTAANSSAIILTPSAVLYIQEEPPASSTLSGGAVAGICVAAVVAAAAAGLLLLLVLRRRQQRRRFEAAATGSLTKLEAQPSASVSLQTSEADGASPQTAAQPDQRAPAPSAGCPANGLPLAVAPLAAGAVQQQGSVHGSPLWGTPLQSDMPRRALAPVLDAPMAPSPFALDAQQAFAPPPAASPLATSDKGSLPSSGSREEPMTELLDLVRQQDRQQQSQSGSAEGDSQLLALPSNLPPELTPWIIPPADIVLMTWANGSRRELGSGAR